MILLQYQRIILEKVATAERPKKVFPYVFPYWLHQLETDWINPSMRAALACCICGVT